MSFLDSLTDLWNDFTGDNQANAAQNAGNTMYQANMDALDEYRGLNQPYIDQGRQAVQNFQPFLNDPTGFNFLKTNPLFGAAVKNANRTTMAANAAGGRAGAGGTVDQLFQNYLAMGDQFVNSGFERAFLPTTQGQNAAMNQGRISADLLTNAGTALSDAEIAAANANAMGTGNILNAGAAAFDWASNSDWVQNLFGGDGTQAVGTQTAGANLTAPNSSLSANYGGSEGSYTPSSSNPFIPGGGEMPIPSSNPLLSGANAAGANLGASTGSLAANYGTGAVDVGAGVVNPFSGAVPANSAAGGAAATNPLVSGAAAAGAGIAGGYVGTQLGENLFNAQAGGAITGAGAAAGAALGTYVFPVVGTALGAAIGGLIGGLADTAVGFKNNVNTSVGVALAGSENRGDGSNTVTTKSGVELYPVAQNADMAGAKEYASAIAETDSVLYDIAKDAGYDIKLKNTDFKGGPNQAVGSANKLADAGTYWFGSALEGENNNKKQSVAANLADGIDRYVGQWIKAAAKDLPDGLAMRVRNLTGTTDDKIRGFSEIVSGNVSQLDQVISQYYRGQA